MKCMKDGVLVWRCVVCKKDGGLGEGRGLNSRGGRW